jgi:hypothetical protein
VVCVTTLKPSCAEFAAEIARQIRAGEIEQRAFLLQHLSRALRSTVSRKAAASPPAESPRRKPASRARSAVCSPTANSGSCGKQAEILQLRRDGADRIGRCDDDGAIGRLALVMESDRLELEHRREQHP